MEPNLKTGVHQELNTLVAAASVTIGHNASHLRHVNLTSDPVYGITDDNPTNIRTFHALDALANLCVSRARLQVVSLALQLDSKASTLRITIAENTLVSNETVEYITGLWAKLTGLSDLYAKRRRQGPNPMQWEGYLCKSPEAPVDHIDLEALVGDLTRYIYEFTRLKYEKRVKKWWEPLCKFANKFISVKGTRLEGLEGAFEHMMMAFKSGKARLNTKNWSEVALWMDETVLNANKILGNESQCERWATLLAETDEHVFQLRRAIEKLTSHHRHVQQLIRFAHSPRLRRTFLLAMTTVCVPVPVAPSEEIPLPASTEAWRSFLTSICADVGTVEDSWLESESERLHVRYKGRPSKLRVHSECSLIAYLEANHDLTPPFSYIAISKLCCMPCSIWFAQFNARGGRQYYIRGTHGKWYFPWAPPEAPSVGGLMERMTGEYVTYLRENKKLRTESGSTDASGSTVFERDERREQIIYNEYSGLYGVAF